MRQGSHKVAVEPSLPGRISGHRYIYELVDPRTDQPSYVGLTVDPDERLWNHRWVSGSGSRALREWRDKLAAAGQQIGMRILAGPVPDDEAGACEQEWIEHYRAAGVPLLNARRGGSLGTVSVVWTPTVSEDAIAAYARAQGLTRYPTPAELIAHGLSTAYNVVRANGGHDVLSRQLGLPRSLRDWSDRDAVERAVLGLVETLGIARYPTAQEFAEGGLDGAWRAIRRFPGGHLEVAERLGLQFVDRYWSDDALVQAVRELARTLGVGRYPTVREFQSNGLYGPYQTIAHRRGGHEHFSALVGLPRVMPRQWRADELRREVRRLARDLGTKRYPTQKQFIAHGLGGVYQAIDRQPGGHVKFAADCAMPRATSRGQWMNREQLRSAVTALVEELGLQRYPTRSEFVEAGLNGAYQRIGLTPGGHEVFSQSLGLKRLARPTRSEEELACAVLGLVGALGLDRYPYQREFCEAGLSGLDTTIRRRVPGGHAALARHLALRRGQRQRAGDAVPGG